MKFFSTFSQKYLEVIKKAVSLQRFREIEHIPYKQRVGGSNPSTPTFFKSNHDYMIAFFISQPTQRNTLFSHYSLKEG